MNKSTITIIMLLQATPQWLSLARKERSAYFEARVAPIFSKFKETIKVRMFDSEYFHARVSDVLMLECTNTYDHQLLIEMLRDTEIYSVPYFNIVDIILCKEDAFREFDKVLQ